jgi:hypothetical protein
MFAPRSMNVGEDIARVGKTKVQLRKDGRSEYFCVTEEEI